MTDTKNKLNITILEQDEIEQAIQKDGLGLGQGRGGDRGGAHDQGHHHGKNQCAALAFHGPLRLPLKSAV